LEILSFNRFKNGRKFVQKPLHKPKCSLPMSKTPFRAPRLGAEIYPKSRKDGLSDGETAILREPVEGL
jgi:hypothetical protein